MYNFDLHNDGRYEISDSDEAITWNYNAPTGVGNVEWGTSILNNDMITTFRYDAKLPNTPPGVAAGIISREGRDVRMSVAGGDEDWDPLTFTVDWGDGSPVSRGTGNVYMHTYPVGRYGDFTITASADDSRPHGVVSKTLTVTIEPPGAKEADISGLSWTPVSLETGRYDGVGAFGIDAIGSVFAHNYSSELRRYKSAEVECNASSPRGYARDGRSRVLW